MSPQQQVATATTADDAKVESWVIHRWNSHPDLATILQQLHSSRATGRLMLHLGSGTVVAAEFCARSGDDIYFDAAT